MKFITALLMVLLLLLQYRLWIGDGSLTKIRHLENKALALKEENSRLIERNQSLAAEVLDLKKGEEAIEERARSEMGMIKPGETFYQIVEIPPSPTKE